MADDRRAQVRERFDARCAYCGVHEDSVGATLTVDHHRPRARGGSGDAENLVYACARCNEHKGAYWHEQDHPHVRLLHPGQDDLTQHLRVGDDGRVAGVTPEGAFFVERLRLNRAQLIAYRRTRWSEEEMTAELASTRRRIEALERMVLDLRAALETTADEIERRSKGRPQRASPRRRALLRGSPYAPRSDRRGRSPRIRAGMHPPGPAMRDRVPVGAAAPGRMASWHALPVTRRP